MSRSCREKGIAGQKTAAKDGKAGKEKWTVKALFKNWPTHNLIWHPLMQIFRWLFMPNAAQWIHDVTCPDHEH